MTDLPALRKRLAENLMGWHMEGIAYYDGCENRVDYWVCWKPSLQGTVWHPDEDIEQAMMVLAKIGKPWEMHFDCDDEGRYCVIIVQENGVTIDEHARTPEMTASLAAAAWLRQGER